MAEHFYLRVVPRRCRQKKGFVGVCTSRRHIVEASLSDGEAVEMAGPKHKLNLFIDAAA